MQRAIPAKDTEEIKTLQLEMPISQSPLNADEVS